MGAPETLTHPGRRADLRAEVAEQIRREHAEAVAADEAFIKVAREYVKKRGIANACECLQNVCEDRAGMKWAKAAAALDACRATVDVDYRDTDESGLG